MHVILRFISAIISLHSAHDAGDHLTVNPVVVNWRNIYATIHCLWSVGISGVKKGIILGLTLKSTTTQSFDNKFSFSLVRGVDGCFAMT